MRSSRDLSDSFKSRMADKDHCSHDDSPPSRKEDDRSSSNGGQFKDDLKPYKRLTRFRTDINDSLAGIPNNFRIPYDIRVNEQHADHEL